MAYVNLNEKMTPEQASQIIQALQTRGANRPCPRCNNPQFTLVDGFFNQPLTGDLTLPSGAMALSNGPTVPSVVTACTRCGFLAQHALGVLGLMADLQNQHWWAAGNVANPGVGGAINQGNNWPANVGWPPK